MITGTRHYSSDLPQGGLEVFMMSCTKESNETNKFLKSMLSMIVCETSASTFQYSNLEVGEVRV